MYIVHMRTHIVHIHTHIYRYRVHMHKHIYIVYISCTHLHTHVYCTYAYLYSTYAQSYTFLQSTFGYSYIHYTYTCANIHTGWRRCTGCFKLQASFRKRATNYGALSQKLTYKDEASYESLSSCIHYPRL